MSASSEPMTELIVEVIQFARTCEALVAAAATVSHAATMVGRVGDIDEDLAPELVTALKHLSESGQAIQRALAFVDARYHAVAERVGVEEGDEDATP